MKRNILDTLEPLTMQNVIDTTSLYAQWIKNTPPGKRRDKLRKEFRIFVLNQPTPYMVLALIQYTEEF